MTKPLFNMTTILAIVFAASFVAAPAHTMCCGGKDKTAVTTKPQTSKTITTTKVTMSGKMCMRGKQQSAMSTPRGSGAGNPSESAKTPRGSGAGSSASDGTKAKGGGCCCCGAKKS